MSAPKLVRAAQTAVFNQFMTREALVENIEEVSQQVCFSISSATFRPAEQKIAEQPKLNIRLHDESTHLKFGFPKSEKQVSIP